MSDKPARKKPGPKPSGQPRKISKSFTVSPAHAAWLDALPNRSAWLAEQIEKMKHTDSDTKPVDEPNP